MKVACLVGNGTSMVYNPELAIDALTDGIKAAYGTLGGTAAGDALVEFANAVAGNARKDFEGLLGPLDHITQALPVLSGAAAPFAKVDWIAQPLNATSEALGRLHQIGLGTALNLIADRAHGQGEDAREKAVGVLVGGLCALAGGDRLTLATLNYDGLLMSALDESKVADLARGGPGQSLTIAAGIELPCWPLREIDDLPEDRQIHLLQLHGSLGWVRRPDGTVHKFKIDSLRTKDFWNLVASGKTDSRPVVVLTDRKETIVRTPPFALAYEILRDRLMGATHWCIAGYGFLDVPVNKTLGRVIALRRDLGLDEPKLLVLGHGDADTLKATVQGALKAPPLSNLFVDGEGMPASVHGAAWSDWAAS